MCPPFFLGRVQGGKGCQLWGGEDMGMCSEGKGRKTEDYTTPPQGHARAFLSIDFLARSAKGKPNNLIKRSGKKRGKKTHHHLGDGCACLK